MDLSDLGHVTVTQIRANAGEPAIDVVKRAAAEQPPPLDLQSLSKWCAEFAQRLREAQERAPGVALLVRCETRTHGAAPQAWVIGRFSATPDKVPDFRELARDVGRALSGTGTHFILVLVPADFEQVGAASVSSLPLDVQAGILKGVTRSIENQVSTLAFHEILKVSHDGG